MYNAPPFHPATLFVKLEVKILTSYVVPAIDNVDNKALEIAENKISNQLLSDERVLTKKVLKKTVKNSKIEVEVFVSTEENITAYQEITNANIDELNKE